MILQSLLMKIIIDIKFVKILKLFYFSIFKTIILLDESIEYVYLIDIMIFKQNLKLTVE